MNLLKDFFRFLKIYKAGWIAPIVLVLLIISLFIVGVQKKTLFFVYSLF